MFASNVMHINRRGMGRLMTLSLLLVPLLSAPSASVHVGPAYTEVGGPIISDTTWTLANSPYILTSDVQVMTGTTLTIEPGVVVKFATDKLLQVDGTLIARGTAARTIAFTSNQPSPAKGDWKNIKFTDNSIDATLEGVGNYYAGGSILEYCVVEYGGNGVLGAVQTDQAAPLIDHCTARNNASSGIYAVGTNSSPVVIRNSTISGNSAHSCDSPWNCFAGGAGICVFYATVTGNTISGNGPTGGYFFHGGGIYAANAAVTSNTISGNSSSFAGGGIYAVSSTVIGNIVSANSATGYSGWGGGIYAVSSAVTGNTVSGNSAQAGANYSAMGGGIFAEGSTVTENVVTNNSAPGYYGSAGGIFAENGSLVKGNIVSHNSSGSDGGGIYVNTYSSAMNNTVSGNSAGAGGGIVATNGSPVMNNIVSGNSAEAGGGICAAWSSTVVSNTVSGNSAVRGGGIFAWKSGAVVSNTVTANNVSTETAQGSGVYFSAENDLLYNTIVGNTAISPTAIVGGVAMDGAPQFLHNDIYGNSNYDLVVLSSQDISGMHNYWGTVATVDIQAHVYDGDDDSARGRLLIIPYLQDPDPDAPVPPPQNLRANFTGGSTNLSWDAIPSTTTGYGYKVYYDTDASGPPYNGTGAARGNSPIDVGKVTHFTLSGLGGGVHIAVTGYDTQGRESWYSNEADSSRRIYLPVVFKR